MGTREYKMYINGEWVDALDKEVYDDLNPYTGEVLHEFHPENVLTLSALLTRPWRHFPRGHIRSRLSARPCS